MGFRNIGRPKISQPYFATPARSTISPSRSSTSSASSSGTSTPLTPLTASDLHTLAITLLTYLSSASTLSAAVPLIRSTAQIQHEDHATYTSRASFLSAWGGMLDRVGSGFEKKILEVVPDEREQKVWVRSVLNVGDGTLRDCVTTMMFDEEGLCVKSWDVSRPRRSE